MDYEFQADKDFTRARRRAFLRRIGAFLRRDPGSNRLLSFDEVKSALGDAYFVRDGNHRVSVAHQLGVEVIDAEVIELRSRVPIDSALTARDLLHKLEQRKGCWNACRSIACCLRSG